MSPADILNSVTQSPAAILVIIIICLVFGAMVLARFTTKRNDDNGLIYEYQKTGKKR